jgi:uncharacterized protein
VVKFPIANVDEGYTQINRTVELVDLELDEATEFRDPVQIVFEIQKVGHELFIKARLKTGVHLTCDRCAEPFTWDVNEVCDIMFTRDLGLVEEDEDTYLIQETTTEVDITDSVRQTLLLALPIKRLCHVECKGLCDRCGVNLNREKCSCAADDIDPRWETLKKLKQQ